MSEVAASWRFDGSIGSFGRLQVKRQTKLAPPALRRKHGAADELAVAKILERGARLLERTRVMGMPGTAPVRRAPRARSSWRLPT